ncbi:MAG: hypothetical protein RR400_03520, partial [Clostridia bacterium]
VLVNTGLNQIALVDNFSNYTAGDIALVSSDKVGTYFGGEEDLNGTIPGTMTVGKEYKISMQRSFKYWGSENRFHITYFKNIRYIAYN